jgi:nucleoside-diphosphate-sugar epimerase
MSPLVEGVDAVVHLAARSDRHPGTADAQRLYRAINVDATLRLARAAARAGVAKFVFLSSVYVNGDESGSAPFGETDEPSPQGLYGRSKFEAESGLRRIAAETGMSTVIVRPPIVVGPSPRGSMALLCRLIRAGLPLPFSSINNLRNVAGLRNVVAFTVGCLSASLPPGCETFLICDQPALSTPDLIRRLARFLNRPARLTPMPETMLQAGARLMGQEARLGALWKSQAISTAKAESQLGWRQPVSLDGTLEIAANGFLSAVR